MRKQLLGRILLQAALAGGAARGDDQVFPAPDWREQPSPLASPAAIVGGELAAYGGPYPKSFNYYLDQNVFSAQVFGWLYDTLLGRHDISLDFEPALADRWTVGADQRTFTFRLDPAARWSDGRPVTAADVAWTFDAVLEPRNLTGPHKIGLERFEKPELLDPLTIRFRARTVHWDNLMTLAGLQILPRHAFASNDFNLVNFEFPVVSGPYRVAEVAEGRQVVLMRRADWWARGRPRAQGLGNFERIRFRFFNEEDNAFEAFRRGELDIFPVYKAQRWATETSGERFDRHWIVKQRIANQRPVGFQGFAMNLRRAPFDDRRVRRALALLLDRARMNRTIMYDAYFLHRSYFEDLYDAAHPCANERLPFDQAQARRLLDEAGWATDPASGFRVKDGRRLVVRFLTRSSTEDKFLAIYQQDLKDAGVDLVIDKKDWAAWSKDMDTYNFDMTWAAWSAGVFKDPESMWHSSEADRPSGQNITGFRHPEVDRLIERQRTEFDVNRRHAIVREIDAILTQETPYILLWNLGYTRLLYWNKFGMPPTVLGRFNDERAIGSLWWCDEDAAAELRAAMDAGLPLARPAEEIRYEDVFKMPVPPAP